MGNGSSSAPYQIATLADLEWLSKDSAYWDKHYIQIADIDASETKTWNSGSGFSPIGNDTTNFTGTYNGKGHVITGLYIKCSSWLIENIGMFGYANNAAFDSLGLADGSVEGRLYVGGLVGYNKSSPITNCYITGTVSSSSVCGGLVGINEASPITNCYTTKVVSGYWYAGGLVGNNSLSPITNCFARGRVSGNNRVGGLIGTNSKSSSINNCYATGAVSGYENFGGLVGYNNGSPITNCYASGDVSGKSNAGGLVGANVNSSINRCYASGNVSNSSYCAGGLIGCTTDNTTITNCYALGAVSGHASVGGLVGYQDRNSSVTSCYATGIITFSTDGGALMGHNGSTSSSVTGCYWNSQNTGLFSGCGSNSGTFSATGKTTAAMQQQDTFAGWDFTTTWEIREGKTYPALQGIDNAPFAFADTLKHWNVTFSKLLANDYDYETLQENLLLTVTKAGDCTVSGSQIIYPDTASNGDTYSIVYRAGEVRAVTGDTLWGSRTTSIIEYYYQTPVPGPTSFTITEDNSLSALVATDADGDIILYTILSEMANGTAKIVNDTLFYTPSANFYGSDSMQFAYTDGVFTDTAWINITVIPVNDAPVARDTVITVYTATATSISLPVSDTENQINRIYIDTYPTNGSVSISGTGILYTSHTGFTGNDTIGWYAKDDEGLYSDTVILALLVINHSPVLTAVSAKTINEDTVFSLSLADVTATDADGDALSLVIGVGSNYTAIGTTITPATNYYGTLYVPIAVTDGKDTTATKTMTVTVKAVNDSPILMTVKGKITNEDVVVTMSLSDVTATDADGDALSLVIGAGSNYAASGTTITPVANYYGTLYIPIAVTDGTDTSATITMTVIVTSVNDAPVARDTITTTLSSTTITLFVPVSDVDGTVSKIYLDEEPSNGTATILGKAITYTSNAGFSGRDSLSWFAKDNSGAYSNTATLIIKVILPISNNLAVSGSTIASGNVECFNAYNTITVAASDPVIFASGSSVELVAGKSILFLPGFHAQSGSYMDAHITSDSSFCDGGSASSAIVAASTEKSQVSEKPVELSGKTTAGKSIKVYPNPNNGQFTLELENIENGASIYLYNMLGTIIYQSISTSDPTYKINLSGIRRGIYFVKVVDKDNQLTKKMAVY